ncbi:MAG: cell division protein FtsL [Thermodesulfobacteriota bacterium]
MANVRTERLGRPGHMTLRKGNRRAEASFWADRGRLSMAVLTAIVFVLFALGFVWSQHQCVRAGYAITAQHRERAVLDDLNRKYKVELANLTSLDRLEKLARTELGLTAPKAGQVQVVE